MSVALPLPAVDGRFVEGPAAVAAVPVSARINARNSEPSTWRATGFDGLAKADPEAARAVTAYLRRPALLNRRLRFRDDPAHPLHEQTMDELLGWEPPNATAVAAAAQQADARIAAMDRVMQQSRLASGIVTWRGVGQDAGLRNLSVGDEFTDPGYVSTSAKRSVAEGSFATDALLRIKAPEGTPALSFEGLGEAEILLGRGLTFRIVGESTTDRGVRLLDVEAVVPVAAKSLKHLPGQHNQQSHGNSVSSPNAIKGIPVVDIGKYEETYGEIVDDKGVRLADDMTLTARYFESGDMHVALDLEDGKTQVFQEMEPEAMRQLAYNLEDVLAVDETEFEGGDPYGIVADADSSAHGFYVAKDGVGDIQITPPDAEDDDYLGLSEEQALEFVNALLDMADSYEEHFADVADEEDVKAGLKHPGHPDQSVHGRRRKPPVLDLPDIPTPPAAAAPAPPKPPKPKPPKPAARRPATPRNETAPKPASPPAPTVSAPSSRTEPASRPPKSPRVVAAEEHVKQLTTSLPASLRKPVADELLRQAQIAPGSMMKLRGLGTADLGGSGAEYKYPGGTIDINSRWKTNKRGLDASFKASRADGYLTPSGSSTQLGGAVAHEFGHRIAFRAIDPNAPGISTSVSEKLLGPLAKALGVAPPSGARGPFVPYPVIKNWMAANRSRISSQISEYGAESVHEMLGEAWQEFSTMGDKARPAAKAVGQALLRMFEGGA